MGALADRIRRDSVNADSRQQHRDGRKYAEQERIETATDDRFVQVIVHRLYVMDWQAAVQRECFRADRCSHLRGIRSRAHHEVEISGVRKLYRVLKVRKINGRNGRHVQTEISDVAYYTGDRQGTALL